ncbi:N-acyl-D-amino-acid deacylase family protein [Flagellimonas algicola]|uniref:Amidohydrolase family protein n=1 Tax=Flagellimonas algicola TaxID=2583815 RepID=A0ABY2WNK5_9FLAO|nr:amidohydrolase family protein [Allomuricauda algicola]TMU56109.1 amidohydrolase family protein [Allomuricauda algicola]
MARFLTKALVLCFWVVISCSQPQKQVDLLIVGGQVFNGVDEEPAEVAIGIQGDKIIWIGDEIANIVAQKTIDAKGLIVSPGFIDPHTHADRDLIKPETAHNLSFLKQGVTTVVVGNDGDSFYPLSQYKQLYESQGIGTNVVPLVGHHEVIESVIGNSNTRPTANQVKQMCALVQQEMDAGAFGMSTGLYYAPGSYTQTSEVVALAEVVAKNGGIYDTHLRDEGSSTIGLLNAVEEAIEIGRKAQLPVHISHIKCLGVDVWKQSDSIIALVKNAQKEGIEVTANQYPYDASATSLNAAVSPRWAESGGKDSLLYRARDPKIKKRVFEETKKNITKRGGPDKLLIVKCDDERFLGKTLLDISNTLSIPAEEAVYEVLESGYVRVASFNMNAYDINNFMKQEWVVTGSDGNTGHPRKYGSFPRKYHMYVKEKGVLDLPAFINASSARTAEIFRIPLRGKLKEGFYADIILFDPETFKDKADYRNAFEYAEGLEYSIINGKLAVEKGEYTNGLFGKVLRKDDSN